MYARVELPATREVCPTITRRLLTEGALLVDVRERQEIERLAFDVQGTVVEQRFAELPRDRQPVMVCQTGACCGGDHAAATSDGCCHSRKAAVGGCC